MTGQKLSMHTHLDEGTQNNRLRTKWKSFFFSQKYTECYTMLWSFAYYQREGSLSVITEAKTVSLSIGIRYILATMLP